jgi:hypothetical protein
VVASVAEAELGAAFQNGQKAVEFRNTLHELGYPQTPTTIMIDNTVAEGLAADTINADSAKDAYEQAQTKWEQASGQKEKVEANIALKRARARYQVVKATV